MNREISFRALKDDMSNCKFVYGQLVYDAIGQPRITEVDKSGQGLTFHTCIRNSISQFTTKKDIKGNNIYENDIVKVKVEEGIYVKDFIGIVDFFEGAFYIKKDDKPFGQSRTPLFSKSYFIEIIGNVFENPELQSVS